MMKPKHIVDLITFAFRKAEGQLSMDHLQSSVVG
jgi:hypothetical protein